MATIRYFISNTVISNNGNGITPAEDLAISIAENLLYGEKGEDVRITDVSAERHHNAGMVEGGIRVTFEINGWVEDNDDERDIDPLHDSEHGFYRLPADLS